MTTFFLVRHATHALLGRVLVGRTPGVGLDATGRRQAADLAQSLAGQGVTHLQSSPRRRARDTAAPMARALSLPIAIEPALDEIDVGAWSGRSFAALKLDPDWDLWNARRSAARPPGGGETMAELQCRVAGHLAATAARWPHARIVAVTHAEPIRAAILHVRGMALDDFAQIDIAPASITTIAFGATGADVVAINQAVAA
ncbi:MAG TPA: histidine phosphatase family protein [Xanthobacteraceae bacterium]|nr:histidine phosphatase family protein [Xanthobacteraceae bacterium]